jgi:hypothetical protein
VALSSYRSTVEEIVLAAGLSADVYLVTGDYRDATVECPACEDAYLTRSCDLGATWLHVPIKVDSDAPPYRVHSEEPIVVVALTGRVHVAWYDIDSQLPPADSDARHGFFDQLPLPWDLELPGTLRVERAPTGLRLGWDDADATALGYNVYGGTIRSLRDGRAYDHGAASCAVPRTIPATAVTLPLAGVDSYYLVGQAGCGGEGALGRSSFGDARPVPATGLACGPFP